MKNVLLVTNMWGNVSHEVGEARERELASTFLKPALDKGAQMIRHHNTEQSAHDVIRCIMNNHPVVLQVQCRIMDEYKDAGEAINAELTEQIKRHKAEVNAMREEITQALREKDEMVRQELEEERRRLQEEMQMVMEQRVRQ